MQIQSIGKNYIACKKPEVRKAPKNEFKHNVNFTSINNLTAYDYLLECYKQDFIKMLRERKEDIYNFLDEVKVSYRGVEEGNIKDVLLTYFHRFDEASLEGIYHRTPKENADKIIAQQAFDPTRITTTDYGPGLYFGTNETAMQIYSGVPLRADFEGRIAYTKEIKDYNHFTDIIEKEIRKYLGLEKIYDIQKTFKEHDVLNKFIHQYCREKIANDLGIDAAHAVGSEGYFVIFNPDSIKQIY